MEKNVRKVSYSYRFRYNGLSLKSKKKQKKQTANADYHVTKKTKRSVLKTLLYRKT